MLYPGSAKPLYEQLKDVLKQRINSDEFKTDEALPGERQLMDMYGVSRVTVRQAIGEMVNEGLLYRVHGKGTFVAPKRIERPLARLLGVAEELTKEGYTTGIKVIEVGSKMPEPAIRRELKLAENETVFMVSRLILADQQPLLLDYSYFPQTIGQLLANTDLSRDLIYTQLELYGYKICDGEQRISAGRASQEEAKYLQCKVNSPVLVVKRTTFVEGEFPIHYSIAIYRGDRYQYKVNLKRYPNGY